MEESTNPSEASSVTEPCPNCDEYLTGWKRAQADYQNLKRETDAERIERAKFANERLLRDLLPVLDQFGLALSFVPSTATLPEAEKSTWDKWLVGIKAVQSLWDQAAGQAGLERVATDGAFDPQIHDAVAEEPSEKPEGTILRVVQPGWRLHGRVLQPARVIIAKAA
jgi:molecular chaperone GrpE